MFCKADQAIQTVNLEIRRGQGQRREMRFTLTEEMVGDMTLDKIIKAEGWPVGKMRAQDSSLGQAHLFRDWKARVTKIQESPMHQKFCIPDVLLKMNAQTSKQEEQLGCKPSAETEKVPSKFILIRTRKKRKQMSPGGPVFRGGISGCWKNNVIHYVTSNKNTGCHEMQAKAR